MLDKEVDRPDVVSVERPFFDVVPCVFGWGVLVECPFEDVCIEGNG